MQPKALEQAFLDAARAGGESQLRPFLDAMEIAIFSLARHAGTRYLIAALETPALTEDDIARVQQIAESAKSSHIQVFVVDPAPAATAAAKKGAEAWRALSSDTGGVLVTGFAELDAALPKPAAPVSAPAPAPGPAATLSGPLAYIRLFRMAPASARRSGSTLASMRGLLIVEAPLRHIQFVTEGKNYSARVKVMQIARRKDGEVAWQANKEIAVKGPVSKLDARKGGSIILAREVQLPAGDYTLEAAVEDLNAARTGAAREPFRATDTLPGLSMSSALLVRKLNKAIDVFDADQVLQYDGEALAPRLNPVFPANESFELPVYFLFYPDMNGKRPQLRLDILQKGQVVGGSDLAFSDNLRDDARSGQGASGLAGEQKHEFPYLAKLAGAIFGEGEYEVQISIRQDSGHVEGKAPFRVAAGTR